MSDLRSITDGWLRQLEDAVLAADVASVVELFLPNGWLRDILVFSWDSRSLEGHKKIFSYLDKTLHNVQLSRFKLDDAPGYSAELVLGNCIGAGFTFDMPDRRGRGYVRLSAERPSNQWRALSLFMMVDAIKEHEELAPELGTYDKHTLSWQEVHRDRLTRSDTLAVGAGQTGLHMAARFKQMNIPTIVLEKKVRVGDQWRELLYQPYPKNWPIYTPRDRVADWLEQYAIIQDLVVWRSSYVLPGATTGWHDPRDTLKEIFGAEVIQRTSPCWGLGEECEIQGCCRPTGHPGVSRARTLSS
ncbi:hypothetical protein WOLCODRAFT_85951 [Wolfiporia cocos MD-104 SS10]|uniref:FAD/NAD(P)-binding domain-containing protein n=1 Tax=Wolfiporia cocos (strain MD-104) TaxID=742152 RepID=A0A2H3JBI5_WOLCO|nr:hypothetical protein WOLCODRAFT_85951 [Wolfiporia cocos MD-104 SS10]